MSTPDSHASGDDSPDIDEAPLPERSRLGVARDIAVFQIKLFFDGLRDVLLSPISIVLGLVGLFVSKNPGEPFYRLLRAGKATENWIDLFGDAYPDVDVGDKRQTSLRSLEYQLRALEKNLSNEDYDQGARDSIARLRKTLDNLVNKQKRDEGDTDHSADGPGPDHH